MICIVDMTHHSRSVVSELQKRLNAKRFGFMNILLNTFFVSILPPAWNAIWLFVWDDSSFSGKWLDAIRANGHGARRMDNSFFVHLNKSPYINKEQHLKMMEEKFGHYKDRVRVISPNNQEQVDELCKTLLRLERK